MKIRVFQSDKGDCLLLTSNDGKHILADGGMPAAYKDHVAPDLGKMRQAGEELDLVYVSHIDEDHIGGLLRMLDDAMDWKIHDFQVANGNPRHREPKAPRPPEIKSIWHNSFHEQLDKNAGPIEEMLAATAPALSLRSEPWASEVSEHVVDLISSTRQAVLLSRRIGSKQLNIPLNEEYGGGLMFVSEPPDFIDIGSMRITVIGPFVDDLEILREKWNAWLRSTKGKEQLAKIKRDSREDEGQIGNREIDGLLQSFLALAGELGDRKKVTPPNLASLMLLIEENGHSVIMSGDGHPDEVLAGLDIAGKLRTDGTTHVDVLKMLHHGSEFNWSPEFGRAITADEYVFCGDGSHENPDLRVVQGVIDSRIGPAAKRSKNPEVGNPFKISFNSSSKVTKPSNREHMKKLEKIVAKGVKKSDGQMKGFFLKSGSKFDINL